jgi:shikimate kinase
MKISGPIVITGFMGCGKSEVARALAQRLDLAAIDLDDKIATQYGRTAAQLIEAEGEPAFRAIETNTLREILKNYPPCVIALGGGAWITEQNRNLIAAHGGVAVWLDAPFEVCWQRIEASEEDRPLGRTRTQAEQLFYLRRPIYQLANIHVSIMVNEAIGETVARIEASLANYHSGN